MDFTSTTRKDFLDTQEKIDNLTRVIVQHYYQNGLPDVADELINESNLKLDANYREAFSELNHIIDSLKKKNIDPALVWCVQHRKQLKINQSSLEFKLHRSRFLDLINRGVNHQNEALVYARTHFLDFVKDHEKDIQMLMGMLLYNGMATSPYTMVPEPDIWLDLMDTFLADASFVLGVTARSPLAACINAGCVALPALLNIKQIMIQRQVSGIWHTRDELPIEIPLEDPRYHSMFACPILRQQSSESNPPMRLKCGHVISKDALNKLSLGNKVSQTGGHDQSGQGGRRNRKVKCPYCPLEQSVNDARQLHF